MSNAIAKTKKVVSTPAIQDATDTRWVVSAVPVDLSASGTHIIGIEEWELTPIITHQSKIGAKGRDAASMIDLKTAKSAFTSSDRHMNSGRRMTLYPGRFVPSLTRSYRGRGVVEVACLKGNEDWSEIERINKLLFPKEIVGDKEFLFRRLRDHVEAMALEHGGLVAEIAKYVLEAIGLGAAKKRNYFATWAAQERAFGLVNLGPTEEGWLKELGMKMPDGMQAADQASVDAGLENPGRDDRLEALMQKFVDVQSQQVQQSMPANIDDLVSAKVAETLAALGITTPAPEGAKPKGGKNA